MLPLAAETLAACGTAWGYQDTDKMWNVRPTKKVMVSSPVAGGGAINLSGFVLGFGRMNLFISGTQVLMITVGVSTSTLKS